MVSYWKTQWFGLAVGCANLAFSIVALVDSDLLWCFAFGGMAFVWFIVSRLDYNNERIKALEKKAEKYDALVEKVDALQKLLETEKKYSDHLNQRIDSLVYEVKELRKYGN